MSTARHRPERQLWLAGAPGEVRLEPVAEVAIRLPHFPPFTFSVPDELRERVQPGALVTVPFGRGRARPVEAWVLRISDQPWSHTRKPIRSVIARPIANAQLLRLAEWIAEYYHCPPGQTVDSMLPAALRSPPPERSVVRRVAGVAPARQPTAQQQRVLEHVGDGDWAVPDLLAAAGVSRGVVDGLVRQGVLARTRAPVAEEAVDGNPPPACPEDAFALTAAQEQAVAHVRGQQQAGAFGVTLLFGVPGSGKTEVYVRAIRAVIAAGRQAILLVPEIALATQIVERLARRFARVAVLHSRLTDKQRAATLRRVAAGALDVVIGTRTAVFAPCPRLGLIVVDEEQEGSYKNLAAPYYHTRDVAIKRAQLEQLPVVLGSATPSLETWHNAAALPHYALCRLDERVPGARLPRVELVSTRLPELGHTQTLLSPDLQRELRETLGRGEQAILLHNRRGYAALLRCQACDQVVRCERCGTPMIYHRASAAPVRRRAAAPSGPAEGGAQRLIPEPEAPTPLRAGIERPLLPGELKCHRCGRRMPAPAHCLDDTCGGPLERSGLGIQRLEDELTRAFPEARLRRLDSDTMRRREDYATALLGFERGEADILLGTQMVAKGLDFPGVRLVGVLDPEAALLIPDFRARERLFQLLVQVIGRAGRREGDSLALVQSADPELDLLQSARRLDYAGFARSELALRRELNDPPLSRLTRIVCSDARESRARDACTQIAVELRKLAGRVDARLEIDEPQPCVIAKLRDMHRWQLLLRAARNASTADLLRRAEREHHLRPRVGRVAIDVDPLDML